VAKASRLTPGFQSPSSSSCLESVLEFFKCSEILVGRQKRRLEHKKPASLIPEGHLLGNRAFNVRGGAFYLHDFDDMSVQSFVDCICSL